MELIITNHAWIFEELEKVEEGSLSVDNSSLQDMEQANTSTRDFFFSTEFGYVLLGKRVR
jgi:hypothetical protein